MLTRIHQAWRVLRGLDLVERRELDAVRAVADLASAALEQARQAHTEQVDKLLDRISTLALENSKAVEAMAKKYEADTKTTEQPRSTAYRWAERPMGRQ